MVWGQAGCVRPDSEARSHFNKSANSLNLWLLTILYVVSFISTPVEAGKCITEMQQTNKAAGGRGGGGQG